MPDCPPSPAAAPEAKIIMSPNPNRGQQSGPPLTSCAMAAIAAEPGRRAKIQVRHGDLIGQDLIKAAARSVRYCADNLELPDPTPWPGPE